MIYNDELIKIVKSKNFKTFWHCLDYLTMAGYDTMDAFGISLREFGENRVYSDVAFIRTVNQTRLLGIQNVYLSRDNNKIIKIGLVDDSNIHLDGLYTAYRSWINKNPGVYTDVEQTCEIIDIKELTPFLMDYLLKLSNSHYGFEAFIYNPPNIIHAEGFNHDTLRIERPDIASLHRSQIDINRDNTRRL